MHIQARLGFQESQQRGRIRGGEGATDVEFTQAFLFDNEVPGVVAIEFCRDHRQWRGIED